MARTNRYSSSMMPKIWLAVAVLLVLSFGGMFYRGATLSPEPKIVEKKLELQQLGL